MSFRFLHGSTLFDMITGFKGIVTGRADYITGCNQYLVQPQGLKDQSIVDPRWIDEQRLMERLDEPRLTLENKENGADLPAPIR